MLNKITGCESRTVPPLYVLMGKIVVKASHWKEFREGRSFSRESSPPQGMSQKTYALVYSHFREITEMRLSQKNGCGVQTGRRSLFDFLEEIL